MAAGVHRKALPVAAVRAVVVLLAP